MPVLYFKKLRNSMQAAELYNMFIVHVYDVLTCLMMQIRQGASF